MNRDLARTGCKWSEIFVCGAIALGPLSFARPSSAQTTPGRFAIETSQITAAMREVRLPITGVQVQVAAPVTASAAVPRIEVESVSPTGPHQLRLRLACRERKDCMPFFATATYPDAVDVSTLHLDREPNPVADRQHGQQSAVATKDAGMLRAGMTATLEFEADRIHVRIEVISLQNGVPGSRVRVSSVDHKQTYTAQVITPTLLKGELSK